MAEANDKIVYMTKSQKLNPVGTATLMHYYTNGISKKGDGKSQKKMAAPVFCLQSAEDIPVLMQAARLHNMDNYGFVTYVHNQHQTGVAMQGGNAYILESLGATMEFPRSVLTQIGMMVQRGGCKNIFTFEDFRQIDRCSCGSDSLVTMKEVFKMQAGALLQHCMNSIENGQAQRIVLKNGDLLSEECRANKELYSTPVVMQSIKHMPAEFDKYSQKMLERLGIGDQYMPGAKKAHLKLHDKSDAATLLRKPLNDQERMAQQQGVVHKENVHDYMRRHPGFKLLEGRSKQSGKFVYKMGYKDKHRVNGALALRRAKHVNICQQYAVKDANKNSVDCQQQFYQRILKFSGVDLVLSAINMDRNSMCEVLGINGKQPAAFESTSGLCKYFAGHFANLQRQEEPNPMPRDKEFLPKPAMSLSGFAAAACSLPQNQSQVGLQTNCQAASNKGFNVRHMCTEIDEIIAVLGGDANSNDDINSIESPKSLTNKPVITTQFMHQQGQKSRASSYIDQSIQDLQSCDSAKAPSARPKKPSM